MTVPTSVGEYGGAPRYVGVVDSALEQWLRGGGGELEHEQKKGKKERVGLKFYRPDGVR